MQGNETAEGYSVSVPSALPGANITITVLEGGNITVSGEGNTLAGGGKPPTVIFPDIVAGNSTVHVIDGEGSGGQGVDSCSGGEVRWQQPAGQQRGGTCS